MTRDLIVGPGARYACAHYEKEVYRYPDRRRTRQSASTRRPCGNRLRRLLQRLIAAGTAPARKLAHARILLKADQSPEGPGWVDERIAEAVESSQPTVSASSRRPYGKALRTLSRVRKHYVEEGLEAAMNRRAPNREYQRKLDGGQEARLIALSCSEPPKGQARWSLRLLADKVVELEIVEAVSYQTVGRILKKPNSSRI